MRKSLLFGFIFFMFITFLVFPHNVNAVNLTKWKNSLNSVAKTLQNKHYIHKPDSGPVSYKTVLNNTYVAPQKVIRSNYKTDYKTNYKTNYKTSYVKESKYDIKKCDFTNKSKLLTSGSYGYQKILNQCMDKLYADCHRQCSDKKGETKNACYTNLLYDVSWNGKTYVARNPNAKLRYCKDHAGKIMNKYNKKRNSDNKDKNKYNYQRYQEDLAKRNSRIEANKKRGVNCHDYVSYALQNMGVISSNVRVSCTSKGLPSTKGSSKLTTFVPENVCQYNSKNSNCSRGTKVKWLNRYSDKAPLLSSIRSHLKAGDIICQYDSKTKTHIFVYMGGNFYGLTHTSNNGSIPSIPKTAEDRGYKPLTAENNYILAKYVLNGKNDKRNNHNNPRVGSVIRIK